MSNVELLPCLLPIRHGRKSTFEAGLILAECRTGGYSNTVPGIVWVYAYKEKAVNNVSKKCYTGYTQDMENCQT